MTNENTFIGEFCDGEHTHIITVGSLRGEIKRGTAWDARKYCDRRYYTNLMRFNYDPYTGEHIDWKVVKKLLTKETK